MIISHPRNEREEWSPSIEERAWERREQADHRSRCQRMSQRNNQERETREKIKEMEKQKKEKREKEKIKRRKKEKREAQGRIDRESSMEWSGVEWSRVESRTEQMKAESAAPGLEATEDKQIQFILSIPAERFN